MFYIEFPSTVDILKYQLVLGVSIARSVLKEGDVLLNLEEFKQLEVYQELYNRYIASN